MKYIITYRSNHISHELQTEIVDADKFESWFEDNDSPVIEKLWKIGNEDYVYNLNH